MADLELTPADYPPWLNVDRVGHLPPWLLREHCTKTCRRCGEQKRLSEFQRLGFSGNEPRVERRDGGYIVSVDNRPPGWRAEYPSEHRAPPRSLTAAEARLEAIEELCRESDRMLVRIRALTACERGAGPLDRQALQRLSPQVPAARVEARTLPCLPP